MSDITAAGRPDIVRPGAELRTVSAQNLRAHPARDHCLAPSRAVDRPAFGARYGRLFPDLPGLVVEPDALLSLGVEGGVCDASITVGLVFLTDGDKLPLAVHDPEQGIERVGTP